MKKENLRLKKKKKLEDKRIEYIFFSNHVLNPQKMYSILLGIEYMIRKSRKSQIKTKHAPELALRLTSSDPSKVQLL
jgi:hypothetical protein